MKPNKKVQSQGAESSKPRWALLGYPIPVEDEEWIFKKLIRERSKVERPPSEIALDSEENRKTAAGHVLRFLALGKQRKDHSRVSAKMTAPNLPGAADVIYLAAVNNDKKFFVHLGKYLAGKREAEVISRMECDVISILASNPAISARDAVREMQTRGWTMNEESWRMQRMRVLNTSNFRVFRKGKAPKL
jgi:hypothetical protein